MNLVENTDMLSILERNQDNPENTVPPVVRQHGWNRSKQFACRSAVPARFKFTYKDPSMPTFALVMYVDLFPKQYDRKERIIQYTEGMDTKQRKGESDAAHPMHCGHDQHVTTAV